MVKTEAERTAVCDKLFNPEKRIICPRCGNELAYREHGNSAVAYCKTENCISATVKGL